MSTEDTVFKFEDGYILLEDLENLYKNGFVTPEDEIRIFERNETAAYKIKTLIRLYGRDHPFRRIRRTYEFDPLGCPSDDESYAPSCSGTYSLFEPSESPNVMKEENEIIFVDYPLFNVDNEPVEDRITGLEIYKEMKKLRELLPVENWSPADTSLFYFLNRQGNKVAICRLCNFTPFSPKIFFNHLYNFDHIKKLSNCMVSRSSFKFYVSRIENRKEKVETEEQDGPVKRSALVNPFPLSCEGVSNDKERLDPAEVSLLLKLYSEKDPTCFLNRRFVAMWEDRFIPRACKGCNMLNLPKNKRKYMNHVFSEKHLSLLTGVSTADFEFWVAFFSSVENRSDSQKEPTPPLTADSRDTSAQIKSAPKEPHQKTPSSQSPMDVTSLTPKFPLFASSNATDRKKLSSEEISLLIQLFSELHPLFLPRNEDFLSIWNKAPRNVFRPKVCTICKYNTPKNPYRFTKHVMSKTHLNSLGEVSIAEFQFWMKLLTQGSSTAKLEDVSSSSTTTHIESTVSTVEKQSSEKATCSSSPSLKSNSRIPMLSLPRTTDVKTSQQAFVDTLKLISNTLNPSGKSAAASIKVEWKCDFCSTSKTSVMLSSELQAYQHLLTQKHKETMKFTSTTSDLEFWKDWVIRMNGGRGPVEVKKVEKTEQPAKIVPVLKPSGHKNTPRVPLLDISPPSRKLVSREVFDKSLDQLREIAKKKSNLLTLNGPQNTKIDWKCSFCTYSGGSNPVSMKNMVESFKHATSRKHCELMEFKSTAEDIKYWLDWINSLGGVEKVEKSIAAAEVRKSPEVENPVKQIEAEERKQSVLKAPSKRALVLQRSSNNPRVPLLDLPVTLNSLMKSLAYSERYEALCAKVKLLKKPQGIAYKAMNSKCFHCPSAQNLNTLFGVMKHVFDGKHNVNIDNLANSSDFDYWDDIIAKTEPRRTEPKRRTLEVAPMQRVAPVQKVVESNKLKAETYKAQGGCSLVVPEKLPPPVEECTLPLFKYQKFSGSTLGPTVRQIREITMARSLPHSTPFHHPTECGFCKVEMTNWAMNEVVVHAFSVKHLKLRSKALSWISDEEFKFWSSLLSFTVQPHRLDLLHVGGYRPDVTYYFGKAATVFHDFDAEEEKLIEHFDESKITLEISEKLLKRYAACKTCNQWILDPADIVKHYLSHGHLNRLRTECGVIKRGQVDPFLEIIKLYQKPSSGCCIM